jgi:tetratricopeptide (TPR) repeat protein
MNIKEKLLIFIAMCSFIIIQPLNVYAGKCANVKDRARETFAAAKSASEQKKYDEAIRLYEEAAKYYKMASKLKNCLCPKAKGSIRICRKNADRNRRRLENKKVFETYNLAKEKYNMGNSNARSQQWEEAIRFFEEAEEIWETIASAETENGRKAIKSAEKSREAASSARQRLDM